MVGHGSHTASTAAGNKVEASFYGLVQAEARGGVVLGNGKTLVGASISSFTSNGTKVPLIYGKDATSTWMFKLVKGKIVLCNTPMTTAALEAGALGSISQGRFELLVLFPVSFLGHQDFNTVHLSNNGEAVFVVSCSFSDILSLQQHNCWILLYRNLHAKILKSESIKDNSAPVVASFSSRGPNKIIPEIMKASLDLDLYIAFSHFIFFNFSSADKRSAKYSILSGTCMSCPHVAGIAAYVKSFHPDWSPSAIQSALMITAWPLNPTTNPDGVLAYGSGHVDPIKATDPGLVYEALKDDYITMLCSMGYGEHKLRLISRDNSTCPKNMQVYIVYLGSLPKGEFSPMSQHIRVLEDVLEGRIRHIYSF
ncbi:unnamed protein product, partial [Vitis vinifera]